MDNINKYQLAAKCILIMRNQLGETNHPAMREYIIEQINYLSTPGVLDMYKIITYTNCIAMVCDRYDYYPCFKLFDNGSLYVSTLDDALRIHGDGCIRFLPNETVVRAKAVHGDLVGDAITETLAYDQNGNEKKFYMESGSSSNYRTAKRTVNNKNGRSFIERLLRDETIGKKDFLAVCIILIILGNMLQHALKPSLGHVYSGTLTLGVILIPYLFFVYKRAKDTGLQQIAVIATTILAFFFYKTVGLILFFIPTGVIGKEKFRVEEQKEREAMEDGREAFQNRSETYRLSAPWFTWSSTLAAIENQLRKGTMNRTVNEGHPNTPQRPSPQVETSNQQRMSSRNDELEERRARARERIRVLESEIMSIMSQISSAESRKYSAESSANNAKMNGDTYMSYANAETDESRRNGYIQSAEDRYSDADRYQEEARAAEREIDSLTRTLNNLENEKSQLERL